LFEEPSIGGLTKRVEAELKKTEALPAQPIKAMGRDRPLPLSFAQQRLWFLDQFEPGSSTYNIPKALRIKGRPDLKALEQSLRSIIRRHEALRTTFRMRNGLGEQVIAPEWQGTLQVIDLRAWEENRREEEVRRLAKEEAQRPFDLGQGPLLRASILIAGDQEYVLVLNMHHIVSDGWSMEILWKELWTFYKAYQKGEPAPLPELPIQYADYSVWQRQWLSGPELERQLGYWKEKLQGAPAVLELPLDHPRPPVQSYRGSAEEFTLTPELLEGLERLSREQGVTLFMTLLAVFKVLLYRYTSQTEILAGTPIAGRNRAEIEDLIGFFVNTLVLRTDLEGRLMFKELLARVKETALGAYTHQDLPFEKLVEELQPERDLSRSPLFQVMFALQNMPDMDWELADGLETQWLDLKTDTNMFDLTLSFMNRGAGMTGCVEYNTDLFEAETIRRMIGHFKTLLEGIIVDPDRIIEELPLLTQAEEHQLLVEWNDTYQEYPKDKCLHELFAEQAARTPDAVAVVFEGQSLCYAELNRHANQLAHYLQNQGMEPESLVGICLERSLEMVIAFLAVLKAGGAYVPMDPNYPQERIAFMLEDSKAQILLTQSSQSPVISQPTQLSVTSHQSSAPNDSPTSSVPDLPFSLSAVGLAKADSPFTIHTRRDDLCLYASPFKIILLDTQQQTIAEQRLDNPKVETRSGNLAYIIYTSGTTGKPKGVMIRQRSLVNAYCGWNQVYELGNVCCHLQMANMAFDVFSGDLARALCSGGKLVLCPRDYLLAPEQLYELMQREQTECAEFVPAVLKELVRHLEKTEQNLDFMRLLICGSDVLRVDEYARFLRLCKPRTRLLNTYGLTEATIDSSYFETRQIDHLCPDKAVPIGRPFPNTRLYILDGHRQPMPVGIPGELYVGGDGVAAGYWDHPELTAKKFIRDPFSADPEARLYKTGDLCRWLADGNIEYLGRADFQVKIRGFRVEPGEIETTLTRHAQIREALVLCREDKPGDKRLVAYLVPIDRNVFPETSDLRAYLKTDLPEYMVPTAFVMLEALPLSPNGKVDRKALPVPELKGLGTGKEYVGPRTLLEEEMAGIWSKVLGVEHISIHANFFEIGGHSLLATQVVSRIRAIFQVELPIRALFEEPTIGGLAKRVEAVLKREEGLLAGPILPQKRAERMPLSFAQERLWFLYQLEPETSVYNIPIALRIKGGIDLQALEQSLREVVRRHEALRTTFETVEGRGRQVIASEWLGKLTIMDLRAWAIDQREAEVKRLVEEEAQELFDLSQGPLLRANLAIMAEEEHVLILNMHHIVSDGWSMQILWKELWTLYQAYQNGQASPLSELPIQYADFAMWQREWLSGPELERQLGYWKDKLQGAPAALELPIDHARPAMQSYRGSGAGFTLSRKILEELELLSQKQGVTLFMTLLAAFKVLLYRYTSQADILVGTPIAGRNRAEIEELIGFFVNTLVLRTDLEGRPTFKELLVRVKETALGAYGHQDLPFEKLVEELQPERNLSRSPLFQVMFVLQNIPWADQELPGIKIRPFDFKTSTSKFELTLFMAADAQGLSGWMEYSSDLFEPETISRMIGHFKSLIEGIIVDPERAIDALPLLAKAEEHQLLVEWNDTCRKYPKEKCIHELFTEQAERTPDAVAVVFEDQCLCYRELNRRANQLAHYLQKQGIGPESLVGICLARSLEMVISLLAVLKAGGAYVPMDPNYPQERIGFMVEDAGIRIILTQSSVFSRFTFHVSPLTIYLDTDWETIQGMDGVTIAEQSLDDPKVEVPGGNLAYVIYTSGSTGKPKGVMVAQQALTNHMLWITACFSLTATDIVLQKTPFSFDASIWEYYAPLMKGACLLMAHPYGHQDPVYLVKTIETRSVTILQLVPSLLRMIVAEPSLKECFSLRKVFCGGEALTQDLAETFHDCCQAELVNLYGPTEVTIDSIYWDYGPETVGKSVIGRPVANTQAYILDHNAQPVPLGVAGELYIGGAQVARGYLNRPYLTAEKFVPDLFSAEPGTRLYKTGDLARYLPDGSIEYLGRTDFQVKIRGFRVELGEIEAVLARHAQVQEAIVLVREDKPGNTRLAAYLVSSDKDTPPKIAELRDYLKANLPEYMVPSAFVTLKSLPLMPNGKVDRKALPTPEYRSSTGTYAAPRTLLEEEMAGIWSKLLGVERIGMHDTFFELGGHSLLAMQVISRLRQVFQVELPMRALFEEPTIGGLAKRVETAMKKGEGLPVRPIELVSRDRSLPLSFAQQRLWFLDQLEPGSSAYNIPMALRIKGGLNPEVLERSLNEIVRRHEALRTTFESREDQGVQVIASRWQGKLQVIDLRERETSPCEEEVQRLVEQEAQKPFDLGQGPLLRASLFIAGDQDHVLLLNIHHIVLDAWSEQVLRKELWTLYEAYQKGQASPLPEPAIQYADFAAWQREWLRGPELERQIGYWKEKLQGAPAALELPADHPRPPVQSYQGAGEGFTVSREISTGLEQLSQKQGVTLFMTLLAIFKVLLYRYTSQSDILAGTPIANRNRTEIEDLIGFFLNTLVLRTDLGGRPTFKELLARVKETALGAYAHQELPFEKLVEELQPERDLSRSPLFQAMFVLQNLPGADFELSGVETRPFEFKTSTSKFDLTLFIKNSGEGIAGWVEYSTDLFEQETILRMIGHFKTLLAAILVDPEQVIDELPLLTEVEEQQLLTEWNEIRKDYARDKCLHALFEEQVEKTPDSVAVVYAEQGLSYAELNYRANQLAHDLDELGVGPETRVGICLERSLHMITGLLGTLKAGGVCVPLDPSYPPERLSFILGDAGIEVLVTSEALGKLFSEYPGRTVCLDEAAEPMRTGKTQNLHRTMQPENLLYVLYTSGSTGQPKGVAMSQGVLGCLVLWQIDNTIIADPARTLQFTSLNFDVAFQEIFATLGSGGVLILIPEELRKDPLLLWRLIAEQEIERIFLPFVALQQLAEAAGADTINAAGLREVITAGEALQITPQIRGLREHTHKDCVLHNQYGPTEAHVVTAFTLPAETADWKTFPAIGRPVSRAAIYLLDACGQPVPAGIPGELYIGGTVLARGYVNRPDLTADRFVPNPFSLFPGARLYKTGDLARYLADGNIEFLGRRDHQVKLRGYRIELGEIEAVLRQHAQVQETVVTLQGASLSEKRLIGYVTTRGGQPPAEHDLRAFLKQRLPEYMVPGFFMVLESLPLTPNGKVDRKALPVPELKGLGSEKGYVAPRTLLEEETARIWSTVLGVAHISMHANFFELGGHSLLATQVISRLRQVFRVELPIRALFEEPTIGGLTKRIEAALKKDAGLTAGPLLPLKRAEKMPLSFAQERLWFLDQLEPGTSVYNIPMALRIKGRLDREALKQSLNEIVRRHETLRTTFKTIAGLGVQMIAPRWQGELSIVDLRASKEDRREEEAKRLVEEEVQKPFDLTQGPLLRASVLIGGEEDSILVLNMHHIVSDGWSLGILLQELARLYEGYVHGAAPSLPELPIQYADFAIWQRQWLQGPELERQLGYWKEKLQGASTALELPLDHPRPPVQSHRGSGEGFAFSRELLEDLERLSRNQGVTLFMTLLAAFKVLLYRYTSQADILVGTPIANRNRAEIEDLVGFFVNTLVLRSDLEGRPTFKELLARVKETALESYGHQDLPFEKLVEELQPERDLSRSPLFQVMFVLQNMPGMDWKLPGVETRFFELGTSTSKFDLSLFVTAEAQGLSGWVEYCTDLFEPETIRRMIGHFKTLVEGIIVDPDRVIEELPLLTQAEEHQLLTEWNDTYQAYPRDKCVHELFAEQAERTPDALAVVFEEQSLCYAELNRRANQLAHYLQKQGVGPESLVGICLERSLEMMIALLGVLKAGGAYVPLDPSYPQERLAFMVEDAGIRILVTQSSVFSRFTFHVSPFTVILLDTERQTIAEQGIANPKVATTSENLAYIIYTSGSTGKPKGTMIPHRGLMNYLTWCKQAYPLTDGKGSPVHSALTFDLTITGLFTPWLVGCVVQLLPENLGAETLSKALREGHDYSLVKITPAHLELLNQQIRPMEAAGRTRAFIIGGENLAAQSIRFWQEYAPETVLINEYGPTETVVGCCVYEIGRGEHREAFIPIGKPIINTQLYVLDTHLGPVPIGVAGELCIGGVQVARGYLNRPYLTAEKFIPDPFSSESGARLYRTGDLVRYLADGNLEFLGRIDTQVKIRGYRIELGEIEDVLRQYVEVRDAVVLVREDVPGEKRLTAYVTAKAEQKPKTSDLRKYLKIRLPEYMVPSAFVILEALPLTPNGKVDRKALPVPELKGLGSEKDYVAPRTPLEEEMAAIWSEVLGVDRIGLHDNFFELGGHSLLAIKLIMRIREAFKTDMALRKLFEQPTLEGTSLLVETRRTRDGHAEESAVSLPAIVSTTADQYEPFALTDVQQAYWIGRSGAFELGNVAAHVYAEYAVRDLDLKRYETAWQKLIVRHGMLRAVFSADGRQRILEKVAPYCIETLDLRKAAPDVVSVELAKIRNRMSHQVLPADQWPLFEIRATILEDDLIRLHMSTDALIRDAWSGDVLSRELDLFYREPQAELSALEISFRDYVLAEEGLRKSPLYGKALAYWRGRLKTLAPAPELPIVQNPGSLKQPHFTGRMGGMESGRWQRLKERAAQSGLTPSAVLLAAFSEVLAVWSKNPRFTINLTLFNRLPLHPQVNDIVGDFTSLTLLETDLSGAEPFEERAKRLQKQLWEDLDHRYVSGVQVMRELLQMQGGTPHALMPVVFTSTLVTSRNKETVEQCGKEPELSASFEPVYSISQTPQVWLDHQVGEEEGKLYFFWDAVEELFPAGLMDEMFKTYCGLLERLADEEGAWQARPDRLMELPATQVEQRRDVNATQGAISPELLQTLFMKQALSRGKQAAVITSERTVSYEELFRLSNRIGRWLGDKGVKPNSLVAVVMEKGWEQMAAVIGILNSGAAYLPIDPHLPKERIQYLLKQGEVQYVLTQSWLEGKIEWPEGIEPMSITWEGFRELSAEPLSPIQASTDLAYVIFTSGSTGEPKGVMIDHQGAVNTILDINDRFRVKPADRILGLSALNFDLSVYDIFGMLAAGATLVLPDADKGRDPSHWLDMLRKHQVSLWNTVPALMEMLVEYVKGGSEPLPESLRLVFMSGDWIPLNLSERIRQLSRNGTEIYSGGGATEASIWSISYPITEVDPDWTSIPYGKPLRNQSFQVLDEQLRPRPVWVPGELYIGGIGLAQGYWKDEEKTKKSFIVHPQRGERLYRTGDLGRWLPDGNIEFLGREDTQVKIQGFRIELGEIEVALRRHPDVGESVVTALQDDQREKRLAAYVTAKNGQKPSAAELGKYLKERLPEYMVPSFFMVLESLPLTPNGKVDRKALPVPELKGTGAGKGYMAPRTLLEEEMAGIWSRVLGVEHISMHANFFELGGHSLMATQVLSRLRQVFRVELPIRALFEEPNIEGLAKRVEAALKAEQGLAAGPICSLKREGKMPLSFAQERLWFLEQLEPGSSVYNIPMVLRLKGELDQAALEQSLSEIVRRHEVLRTTFEFREGAGVQVIAPRRQSHLSIVDLRASKEDRREEEVKRLVEEEAQRPFDLTQGPLLRVTVLIWRDKDYVLVLNMHHIVSDGWSLGILLRELATLYKAYVHGEAPSLPELPIQYADFAVWQRQWLQGPTLERQSRYWKEKLKGAPTALELPLDHPRPPVQSYRGSGEKFALSRELLEELEHFSRNQGVTLFVTLLAAFKVLLYRYTSQTDILVGTPIAGRNRAEIEDLIGFFVNTLVLRTDLEGRPLFKELLARVKETALESYGHQDLPFEKLVEELQPQRELSRSPFFQVMFVLQNMPWRDLELPGVEALPFDFGTSTSKFDVSLYMASDAQGLSGWMEYSLDLFEPETIRRMTEHFKTLLEGIIVDPDRIIEELPFLTQAEEHQLLTEWNDTYQEYPRDKCLHELFEEQAARSPDALAVVFEHQSLCYAELNRRANQLAHYLQKQGIGPESLVGICVERSLEMVIALLGVLKAGGAYVPLDPSYPRERIAFMLDNSKVQILLTQSTQSPVISHHSSALKTVFLDTEWKTIAAQCLDNPKVEVQDGNLAYMIYTSGSTGTPKGALNTQGGIRNRLQWMQAEYGLDHEDRILQKTPFSFDVSVWEFFWPLLTGACLVMARPEGHKDSAYLVKTIIEEQITTIHFVPSMLQVFLAEPGVEECFSLKRVICSGEALPALLQKQWFERFKTGLHNLYGPTEAAVDVSYWPCREEWEGVNVPIGRPIANIRIYVLDSYLRPLAVGIPGELHIGGIGLGRGYFGRPDLTAEKFIPDPFSVEPGARLYRTGDSVRYLPDGNIEFLSRLDTQVKIRGFRIELGEIEAILTQHPEVKTGVVIVWEDSQGNKRLVAYIVSHNGKAIGMNTLKEYLKEHLPEYMIPAAFMTLESLPLTPNGKVDRKALIKQYNPGAHRETGYEAPRTGIEKKLALIWRQLLGINQVGRNDNFFQQGGHSLTALQLVQQMRETFNTDIEVRTAFEATTIAELANKIETSKGAGIKAKEADLNKGFLKRLLNKITFRL
jgi:amino acid adenylation domain-containing protein